MCKLPFHACRAVSLAQLQPHPSSSCWKPPNIPFIMHKRGSGGTSTPQPQSQPQPIADLAAADAAPPKRRLFGLLPPKVPALPAAPPAPPPPPAWRVAAGYLASGAIAGCVVEAALYPLDTIKTRLQTMSKGGLQALRKAGGGKALYAGIGCAWQLYSDVGA